ncbi:MAG: peptidyl-prolyl cis-trans isomerase [Solirubrobacterales bacterium]|nr:peptidyl-prolyl cis-trans isomerase [Solirubrobacterales bacterium]
MTKTLRLTSALGAVLFALVGLSACGGGIPGNAVVKVADHSITKDAFSHWMKVAAVSNKTSASAKVVVPDPPTYTACIANLAATAPKPAKGQPKPTPAQLKTQCAQQYKSLQTEVLNFLIGLEWVLGEAPSKGVKISDSEVHKQFIKIRTQQFPSVAEFEKFITNSGQSVSDLLLRVKYNLASQKLQQKVLKAGPKVTQAQIQKYYNENKSRYGVPEKRSLQVILTKTEGAANSAKKEVESGKSFESVAKSKSIDPVSKSKGGLLPEVSKGQEEKSLDTAIFAAQKGVLSGPIKTAFGYYVFKVLSTKPGSQQTLAQVQASIKQQLTSTGQQSSFNKFVKEFKKKWKAKTDCRTGFVVEDCKQYKAPKKSSTGTTAAP